jgi:hypothetical protein
MTYEGKMVICFNNFHSFFLLLLDRDTKGTYLWMVDPSNFKTLSLYYLTLVLPAVEILCENKTLSLTLDSF